MISVACAHAVRVEVEAQRGHAVRKHGVLTRRQLLVEHAVDAIDAALIAVMAAKRKTAIAGSR